MTKKMNPGCFLGVWENSEADFCAGGQREWRLIWTWNSSLKIAGHHWMNRSGLSSDRSTAAVVHCGGRTEIIHLLRQQSFTKHWMTKGKCEEEKGKVGWRWGGGGQKSPSREGGEAEMFIVAASERWQQTVSWQRACRTNFIRSLQLPPRGNLAGVLPSPLSFTSSSSSFCSRTHIYIHCLRLVSVCLECVFGDRTAWRTTLWTKERASQPPSTGDSRVHLHLSACVCTVLDRVSAGG